MDKKSIKKIYSGLTREERLIFLQLLINDLKKKEFGDLLSQKIKSSLIEAALKLELPELNIEDIRAADNLLTEGGLNELDEKIEEHKKLRNQPILCMGHGRVEGISEEIGIKNILFVEQSISLSIADRIPQLGSTIIFPGGSEVFIENRFGSPNFFDLTGLDFLLESKAMKFKYFLEDSIEMKVVDLQYTFQEPPVVKVVLSPFESLEELSLVKLNDDDDEDLDEDDEVIMITLCSCDDPANHDPLHIKERHN